MTPPVTTSTSVTITRVWYRYLFDLSRCCLWLILTYFWWLNPATMFARLFDPNGVVETVMIVGRLKLRDQMLISTNCRFTKPFHSKLGIFTQLWFISRWTLCGGTKSTSRLPAAQAWIRPYWQIPSQGNSLLRNFRNCEEESLHETGSEKVSLLKTITQELIFRPEYIWSIISPINLRGVFVHINVESWALPNEQAIPSKATFALTQLGRMH